MKKMIAIIACSLAFPVSALAQNEVPAAPVEPAPAPVAEPAPAPVAEPAPAPVAEPAPAPVAEPVDNQISTLDNGSIIAAAPAQPQVRQGFSILASVGATVAFYETLNSGYQDFEAKAVGPQLTIDIGYRYEYFGVYLEGVIRGAFAYADSIDSHCPGIGYENESNGYGKICYNYNSIRKGEWDKLAGGIGLLFAGFIPVSDKVDIVVGGGPLVYIGSSFDKQKIKSQFVLKLEVGAQFALTDQLSLGFTISEEGWLKQYRSITPSFTLNYNIF